MSTRTSTLLALALALCASPASADIFSGGGGGRGEKLIRSFGSGVQIWQTRTVKHEKGGKIYERGRYTIIGPGGARTGELDGVSVMGGGQAFRVWKNNPGKSADQFLLDGATLKATHEQPYRALERGHELYGAYLSSSHGGRSIPNAWGVAVGYAKGGRTVTLHDGKTGKRAERADYHFFVETPTKLFRIGFAGQIFPLSQALPGPTGK